MGVAECLDFLGHFSFPPSCYI